MTTRLLRPWAVALTCLALLTFGTGRGQPQPPDEPPRIRALGGTDPTPAEPPGPTTRPAAPLSVDDLITRLEKLRQQKAEIEKQEREVVDQLREIVRSQADRLSKLGVVLAAPDPKDAGKRTGTSPTDPKK